jgi:hypothetical protein
MEYINAKEFLNQPIEIQNVLIEWWNPSKGDLLYPDYDEKGTNFMNIVVDYDNELIKIRNGSNLWYEKDRSLPLFTEGQLRKFIEDKTNCNLGILPNSTFNELYLANRDNLRRTVKEFIGSKDILRAIWELACEVIKEEIKWKKIK